KTFPLGVRATIGVVAASGRTNKPFVTAGSKFHAMKAKSKPYPRVSGVAMNPVDHPFGGFQHHVGHSKSTSRHAPAGRKVG
ncbi:MAG: 50S ribosomal protein L2, partial [Candidatus ainarchaeum sp.]|nr:50S ribosomal protein L2 [Candidatus ainarchaeum sp.]